jgi:hypothetical protein
MDKNRPVASKFSLILISPARTITAYLEAGGTLENAGPRCTARPALASGRGVSGGPPPSTVVTRTASRLRSYRDDDQGAVLAWEISSSREVT